MSQTRLQTMRDCIDYIDFRARHKMPKPTLHDVRAWVAELGINGAERLGYPRLTRPEQLELQRPGTVIRDSEERVLELINGEWLMTGEEIPPEIDLPALVIWEPAGDSA